MKKCKRNIFLIFGYLLIMAGLFLPFDIGVNRVSIEYKFLLVSIIEGYDFSWFAFGRFITEIAVILALGGFFYIIFCVALRKDNGGKK